MKKRAAALILAAAAGLGLGLTAPQAADAATNYSYVVGQGGSTIQSGSTVNATGTQTYNVYLQEVATSGSFQAPSDGGLGAGGVSLVQTGGSGVTFSAVAGNAGTEPTGFSGVVQGAKFTSGSGAWIQDFTGSNASTGVAPISTSTDANGTTTNLYLLGTVTLNLASDVNAAFTVESLYDSPQGQGVPHAGAADGNTVTDATGANDFGYDLDGTHQTLPPPPGDTAANLADASPTTFSIAAVSSTPEPASMAVFALGAVGLLARRRRTA